jgi:hypothetical protein
MPAIFDLLYREYCQSRLTEMRKQLFIWRESREVSGTNCDVDRTDGAADRDGNPEAGSQDEALASLKLSGHFGVET